MSKKGHIYNTNYFVFKTSAKTCNETQPKQNVESCENNSVQVKCPDGESLSVPYPRFLSCGSLHSYNLDNPLENLPRIVCGGEYPTSKVYFFLMIILLTYHEQEK